VLTYVCVNIFVNVKTVMCLHVDKDECATNNGGCNTHASCSNTPAGSFTCTCNNGYKGNGLTCDGMSASEAGLCVEMGIE